MGREEIVYESHLRCEAWRRYNRTSYMTRLRAWFCNSRRRPCMLGGVWVNDDWPRVGLWMVWENRGQGSDRCGGEPAVVNAGCYTAPQHAQQMLDTAPSRTARSGC